MPLYIYGQPEFASIFISLLHINVHFMFDIAQYGASLICLHILCVSQQIIYRGVQLSSFVVVGGVFDN